MMKIYRYTLLAAVTFAFLSLSGQETYKIKKGDKHFESYSYTKAIKEFEPISEKTTDINRKLAESYAHTGNTEKAEEYYSKIINSEDKTSSDIYNYASILQMNGKHEESEKWMKKYSELEASDGRASAYNANPGYYKNLLKDEGRFSIKNIEANSAQEDFGVTYYKDKVVFASSREGAVSIKRTWNWNGLPFLDTYIAETTTESELVEIEQFQKKINKKYHEGPVSFNEAGDFMVFTRNNYTGKSEDGVVKLQMFSSKFIENKWAEEVSLPFNSKEYSVGHASLTADGKTIYFSSDMPGGKGGIDIYKSTLNEAGKWSEAQNLGATINTEGNEMFPFIHEASEMLFFASDGHPGLGGLDIFVAKIKENDFGIVENVGVPVNGIKDDFSIVLDKESKKGYFASNRSEGKGDDDIYSFDLLKPFTFGVVIKGTTRDIANNAITDAFVDLYSGTNLMETTNSDSIGRFEFVGELNKNYTVLARKEGYNGDRKDFETLDGSEFLLALILEQDLLVKELTQSIAFNPINFDYNKFNIRKDAALELDKIIKVMNKYPEMVVELGSYTDVRGSDSYNNELSENRAKASAAYIKKHITNPKRVYGKGYGETKIINRCISDVDCTDKEHEVNRRTEFRIIKTGNDSVQIKNNSTNSFEK